MRITVTGAAGYIGGQTMLNLADRGHTILGVDERQQPDHLHKIFGVQQIKQCDFASQEGLEILTEFQPDCVIHCAGTSLVGPSINDPEVYYQNNFVRTKRLVDHLLKSHTRLVFSSSASVYGEPVFSPCSEVDPMMPISPYGESKTMIEWMLSSYARAYQLEYVAFRYFNACGADSQTRHGQEFGATHIIARVLESLLHDQEFQLYGDGYPTADGTCIRDYVHVQDIAQAHVLAAERVIDNGIYNLGTGQGISNRQIIEAAQRITGRQIRMKVREVRAGDPAILTANADRAKSCGWNPQFDLDHIIQHAWNWYCR